MITASDRAQRLANAILADIALYEETRIVAGCGSGQLDNELADAIDEGLALFRARVDRGLVASGRFFDVAIVRVLGERTRPWWRTGFDRLRRRYVAAPIACAACATSLGADRVAWQGPEADRWLRLLSCARCQSVTGVRADTGSAIADTPAMEATAAVVVRLRERLERAKESEELESAVLAIAQDASLARLLGVPELAAIAEPAAGRLVVRREMHLEDPFGAVAPPWPGEPPRAVPGPALAANPLHAGGSIPAHATLAYLGRTPDGWRALWHRGGGSSLGGPEPLVVTAHRDDVELT